MPTDDDHATIDADLAPLARRIGAVSPAWNSALAARFGAARIPELRAGLQPAVEAIYEGHLLHGHASRVVDATASTSMHLLIGDWCYAAGLCDVAATGDVAAVGTLADLIADVASMVAEAPRPDGAPDPREIRWEAALTELAPHTTPSHEEH